nr:MULTISPECIES: membrane protein [unclassified Prevotella]
MIETLLITTLIIAIGMAFLLVKVLFKRNGEFSSQHIHDSEAMKERGIHCVMDQDREMRSKSRHAVSER